VTFYSNGVILGVAVAIAAHGDLTTELVTNGTFDTDTDWSKDAGWAITGGEAVASVSAANANLWQTGRTIAQGVTYKLEFDLALTASGVSVYLGTNSDQLVKASLAVADNGRNIFYVNANANYTRITFRKSTSAAGTIDNVSLKRVVDMSNTAPRIINGTATTRTAGSLQASRLFNRALTAAEVLDLSINGPALADRGASQTPVYTSDFTVDINGWTTGGTRTLTPNQTINGTAGWLQLNRSSGGTTTWNMLRNVTFTDAQVAKNATILLTLWRPAATTGFSYVAFDGQTGAVELPVDTEVTVTIPLVVASTTLTLRATSSTGAARTNVASNNSIYIKDAVIIQVGLTSELIASNAQSDTGQIFDSSGNKNHALLPASGATVVGRPVSQTCEVRWTNTWAGTNELQYIGGVNQAILPANAYIESIVGTVSGAIPHDIIVGDGSDTDRYVTITTGLAAGTTNFALAARTTDGTNLKLTVDPDTDCSMSIAWVISYRTLEA
jgi:hypothetical protein